MQTVAVLSGGDSSEREVSLRSGAAVADALREGGYKVRTVDPREGLDGTDNADVIFPALHGTGGEDGTIQAMLEMRGVPYVGSGVAASALCWDKWLYRQVVTGAGLPMAKGALVTVNNIWKSPLSKQPFVLKPLQSGSTIGMYIVRDVKKIDKIKIGQSLQQLGTMLLETLIPGVELTVGVLGNRTLPVVEIIPPQNGEFDYDNKYNGKTQELCPPQHVSTAIQQQAQDLALAAHTITGCRDISRTDIMVAPNGKLYLLETNTLPGMTDQSLFPKAAAAAGIPFSDLCSQLVQMALQRKTA